MRIKFTSLILMLLFSLNFFPIRVQALPGETTLGYAWRAYSGVGNPTGLISISIPDGTQTLIKADDGTVNGFMAGGDFVGDQLFMIDFAGNFFEVDYVTGTVRLVGNTGMTTTGFAFDTIDNKAYVLTGSALYSINLETAAVAQLFSLGDGSNLFIDCAFNAAGELYATDIGTDQLFKVNKNTGELTVVGLLGVDINFAQGLSFDRDNNILYGTLYQNGGTSGVYELNTTTGAATKLSDFSDEIDGFAIPYEAFGVKFYDEDVLLKHTFVLSDTQAVTKPADPVKEEMIFTGWNTIADGTGEHFAPADDIYVTEDTVLYAQYKAKEYKVAYDGNGATSGTAPADETLYLKGDTAAILDNTFLNPGYYFAGWNTEANGTGTSFKPGDTYTFGSEDLTLYAQWTLSDYTITYDGNGHTEGIAPVDGTMYHMEDEANVLTGTMTKLGFTFDHWNTKKDNTGDSYLPGDLLPIGTENVVLYAQWTPVQYKVSFNSNGSTAGTLPADQEHVMGDEVVLPQNTLLRAGYRFTGWNTKADGKGIAYEPGDKFILGAENLVLYAQWEEENYTVTYDVGGAKGTAPVDSKTYVLGESVTVLGHTLTKDGYQFAGWNTEKDGSGKLYQTGNTFAITEGNLVLYAQWTQVLPKAGSSSNFLIFGFGFLFILAGAVTLVKRKESL